jgi:hypothetical protein
VSRSLDRDCQRTLVPGARAELAPRLDLASLGDVASEARGVLVIDLSDLVDAESADLAPPTEATAAAAARSASTTARAAWSTPATGTAPPARTVTSTRALALGTASETRPWCFTIWAATAVPVSPLSGLVVAHIVLVVPLPHAGGINQFRVTLRTVTLYRA